MDPLEVIERSGRDYEPATYVEDAPEHEHDPIMVRCLNIKIGCVDAKTHVSVILSLHAETCVGAPP
jgi:hypothetical protein